MQSGAWQSGLPGPQASKSNAERLAAIEISIEANYPGGLRAFDAELIRCYGDGDIRWLLLCSPSILNADRDLALLAAERRDLLQLVGKFPPSP